MDDKTELRDTALLQNMNRQRSAESARPNLIITR